MRYCTQCLRLNRLELTVCKFFIINYQARWLASPKIIDKGRDAYESLIHDQAKRAGGRSERSP